MNNSGSNSMMYLAIFLAEKDWSNKEKELMESWELMKDTEMESVMVDLGLSVNELDGSTEPTKKVVPVDIALIVFALAVVIFGPKLTAFLNGAHRLTWTGWVALLTIVPIVNLSGKSPEISFKDYCKNIFKLPLNRKDKRTDMAKMKNQR